MIHLKRAFTTTTLRRSFTTPAPLPSWEEAYTDTDTDTDPPAHLDPTHLNATLHSLVLSGHFSAAERLRLNLLSNGHSVEPRAEYARVALACLRNKRLSGVRGMKMTEYLTWLELIPDRESLRLASPSSPPHHRITTSLTTMSPFESLVRELTEHQAGVISRANVGFLTNTALCIASKGYIQHHLLSFARPLILASVQPTRRGVKVLLGGEVEQRAVEYERVWERPVGDVGVYVRSALVHLLVQRGWVAKAVEMVLEEGREYVLPDHVYLAVLDAMRSVKEGIEAGYYSKKKGAVLKRWEKDKERRLWNTNPPGYDE